MTKILPTSFIKGGIGFLPPPPVGGWRMRGNPSEWISPGGNDKKSENLPVPLLERG